MYGLNYEDRSGCLNLWSLEERRNRQDLIEVSKMFKGMTRIRFQELFTLEDNNKGFRGHSLRSTKLRCTRDCWKHFLKQANKQMKQVGSADGCSHQPERH